MATWTSPKTWNVGDVLTASDMNTYVRDNSQIWIPTTVSTTSSATTTQTSYANLNSGGAGPAVTVTTLTQALVMLSCTPFNSSSTNNCYMSYAVSGATTIAASDANGIVLTGSNAASISGIFLLTGLTSGSNTFTAKYRVTAGTGTFQPSPAVGARSISVIPLTT